MTLKSATHLSRDKNTLAVGISFEQVAEAIKSLGAKEREQFLEDLLAVTSPEFLASIEEARQDYRHGRVKSHQEVFGS
ncbi:MAG: hypothetical protein AB1393_03100 [Candidatus Edwardsbacteria bacterium]